MVHKFSFIIIFLLVLLGAIVFINGCHRGTGPCSFHRKSSEKKAEWVVKKLSEELRLNDSQEQKLNQIKNEILAKMKNVKGSHEQMFNTFVKKVQSESVDEKVLNQLFEGKEAEFKQMRTFLIAKFAEFHSILEPKRRAKLAELMKKLHRKKHH